MERERKRKLFEKGVELKSEMNSGGWKQHTAMIQLAGCNCHNTYDKEHDMTSVYKRNAYKGPTVQKFTWKWICPKSVFSYLIVLVFGGVSFYLYLFAIKLSMYMISLKTL